MRWFVVLTLVLAFSSPLLMGGSCNSQIVRDKVTFETETKLAEQMSLQTAAELKKFIAAHCTCVDSKWVTEDCRKAADLVVTVETRAPYHTAMALYNAGITKERPPKDAPVIPAAESLCPVDGAFIHTPPLREDEDTVFIHNPTDNETEIFFGQGPMRDAEDNRFIHEPPMKVGDARHCIQMVGHGFITEIGCQGLTLTF